MPKVLLLQFIQLLRSGLLSGNVRLLVLLVAKSNSVDIIRFNEWSNVLVSGGISLTLSQDVHIYVSVDELRVCIDLVGRDILLSGRPRSSERFLFLEGATLITFIVVCPPAIAWASWTLTVSFTTWDSFNVMNCCFKVSWMIHKNFSKFIMIFLI